LRSQPKKVVRHSLNRTAIAKTSLIVGLVIFGSLIEFPAATIAVEWLKDLAYHLDNNTTWLGMNSNQRIAWTIIPGYYLIGLLMLYWFLYKVKRKTLYINTMDEGTVMYIHGIDEVKGNIYDLACVLFNGFRNMDWEDIPKPISMDYYKNPDGTDKIVIYYKMSAIVFPWKWKRLVIDDPDVLTMGVYSVWIYGKYDRSIPHPYNFTMDYRVLSNSIPYVTINPDHKQFEKYSREMLNRISITNNTLLQGNPSIVGQTVKNNLTILTKERISEELESLTDEEKVKLYLKIHEIS